MKKIIKLFKWPAHTGLAALLPAVIVSLYLVSTVAAHALLIKSDPEDGTVLKRSPDKVVAWFSQELDSRLSSMRVFDAGGGQVDNGDGGIDLSDLDHKSMVVSLPTSLPAGTYTVRWAVVSVEDDDETEGEFSFGVGNSTAVEATVAPKAGTSSGWLVGGIAGVLALSLSALYVFARRRQLALG